jgi:hypothetical protein
MFADSYIMKRLANSIVSHSCQTWTNFISVWIHWDLHRSVAMKSSVFWDMILYSPVNIKWHFGRTYCFHLQGWKVSQARHQHDTGSKESSACSLLCACFSVDFQWSTWHHIPEGRTIHFTDDLQHQMLSEEMFLRQGSPAWRETSEAQNWRYSFENCNNSVAFSPQANYTNRAAAACRS